MLPVWARMSSCLGWAVRGGGKLPPLLHMNQTPYSSEKQLPVAQRTIPAQDILSSERKVLPGLNSVKRCPLEPLPKDWQSF